MKQQSFQKTNWDHRFCHGGELRKSIHGRGQRPLSTKDPLHVVFKIRKESQRMGLRHPFVHQLVGKLLKKYSAKFFVKIEQQSINSDHIHLLLRCSKRSMFLHFFRVFAGQLAQQLTDTQKIKRTGLSIWKARPWSRVIRGFRNYEVVKLYIVLNQKEASGERVYRKQRLRGLGLRDRPGIDSWIFFC